ncbi:MAG: hypothetical protein V9H69_19245 [Anaerolineae bacterium]
MSDLTGWPAAASAASSTLQEHIDALIEQVDPDDEADVDRTVAADPGRCSPHFPWLSSAFRDLLDGKNHLPNNKLRVNLLQPAPMAFWATASTASTSSATPRWPSWRPRPLREQARYSVPALKRQRRTPRAAGNAGAALGTHSIMTNDRAGVYARPCHAVLWLQQVKPTSRQPAICAEGPSQVSICCPATSN